MPTGLFILPDGHADRYPGRKILILHYRVGSLGRLPTDVHACGYGDSNAVAVLVYAMLSQLFKVESYANLFRNSSPCLKAGVSLR